MHDTPSEERRQYPRFRLRAYASLSHGNHTWEAHLLDMSMTGARLALLGEHLLRPGDDINLQVPVEDPAKGSPHTLHLRGRLVHLREHVLGVEYQAVADVDRQLLNLLLSQPE